MAHPELERKVRQHSADIEDLYGLLAGLDQKVDDLAASTQQRFDAMDRRLDAVEKRLDAVESRLDAVEKRLDAVESRLDAIENRLDTIEGQLAEILRLLTSR